MRRSVGILGGTFDPPHFGHLAAAQEALHLLQLGRVLWVPAGTPPHKPPHTVTPAEHRLAMVRLAIAPDPRFELSTVELDSAEPSYSVYTLQRLRDELSPADLVFLIGADEFAALRTWHRPELVPALAHLAVMTRSSAPLDRARVETEVPAVRGRYTVVQMPDVPTSSSALRERVRRGLPVRYLVPDTVAAYIEEHALYRG